jgi:hypothetical protein
MRAKMFLFCSLVLQNKDTSKAKIITFSSSLLPYLHFIYPVPYISATILQLVVLLLRYINNHETYIHTSHIFDTVQPNKNGTEIHDNSKPVVHF